MLTTVISAFPGTGKSHFASHAPQNMIVLDSDSSAFSWASKGVRHPDFPANYIAYIKEHIGAADIIFVSSHADVRRALVMADIPFILVYPARELKEEYLIRYVERGSPQAFIDLIASKWDEWLTELTAQGGCRHVVLQAAQYLGGRCASQVINSRFRIAATTDAS